MKDTPLVILAGGLGTRMREETEFKPKPMVEIGGKPILWHIMKIYSSWGVKDFVICTGYKGEVIKDYFLNYQTIQSNVSVKLGKNPRITVHEETAEDWTVNIIDTGALTPTGGRISKIEPYVNSDSFFCTYGDGVANVDLVGLRNLHQTNGSIATLTAVKPLSRFGVLDLEADGKVAKFKEKPRLDTWVNGGYFLFSHEIFARLNEATTLEQEPLSSLAAEGKLSAYCHDGFWQPMDTQREAKILNQLWETNQAEWKIW